MRYSANLNIMVKAVEKASINISRDFIELENLQSKPESANKFASASYKKAKQVLIDEFTKFRPDFNLIFSDGEKIIRHEDYEYYFIINVVDGVENFIRAGSDFSISVALIHKNKNQNPESIAAVIFKIIGGEMYYCEKGFGAFLNNRRLRVSKRTLGNSDVLIVCEDQKLLPKNDSKRNFLSRNYGCKTLEIAYLCSARVEQVVFKIEDSEFVKPFFILLREAGGKIVEKSDSTILSN